MYTTLRCKVQPIYCSILLKVSKLVVPFLRAGRILSVVNMLAAFSLAVEKSEHFKLILPLVVELFVNTELLAL